MSNYRQCSSPSKQKSYSSMPYCNRLPGPTSQRAAQLRKRCTACHHTLQAIQGHAQVLILLQIPILCNLKKRGLSGLPHIPCSEKKAYSQLSQYIFTA